MSEPLPPVPPLTRERRALWDGGPAVSAITLGTSSFGSRIPPADAIAAIRRARSAGVNALDTAPLYGHGRSEELVGTAVAGDGDVVVITKFGKDVATGSLAARGLGLRGLVRPLVVRSGALRSLAGRVNQQATTSGAFSADDADASITRSRARLGDVPMIVLFHSPSANELRTSDAPALLRRLVDDGTIIGFGVSADDPETAAIALELDGVRLLEVPVSSWDRRFLDSAVLSDAAARGVGVLARSPFAAVAPGADEQPARAAGPRERAESLRLALDAPGVRSVVCSASSPEHLRFAIEVTNGTAPSSFAEPVDPTAAARSAGTGTLTNVMSYLRRAGLRQSASYALYRVPVAREIYRRRRVVTAGTQTPVPLTGTAFPGQVPDQLAEHIRRDSYVGGLTLPPEVLDRITALCHRSPLYVMREGRKIVANDRDELVARLGEVPVIAYVDCADDPEIVGLGDDPVLRETFRHYFGYPPRSVEPRVWWSFVTDADEHDRLSGQQTVRFHFDQHAMNFLYANFYLTDVDPGSGAHVLVRGSHARKPLRFALSSAYKTDEEIVTAYGSDDLVMVTGPAGSGIIEDAWCYHKALPPTSGDRLFLQFRYA